MKNDQKTPDAQPEQVKTIRWRERLTNWLQKARHALERAEKRISENFRVPPGGG